MKDKGWEHCLPHGTDEECKTPRDEAACKSHKHRQEWQADLLPLGWWPDLQGTSLYFHSSLLCLLHWVMKFKGVILSPVCAPSQRASSLLTAGCQAGAVTLPEWQIQSVFWGSVLKVPDGVSLWFLCTVLFKTFVLTSGCTSGKRLFLFH